MNSREIQMSRACDWREKHVIIVEETLEKGKNKMVKKYCRVVVVKEYKE